MYSMNNSLMVGAADAVGTTPRTPEILNSLMSMTNPFELSKAGPRIASSPPSDTTSTTSSSPPSIQHTCSQLIKEGLKHSIQTKRRNNSESIILDIGTRTHQRHEEVSPDSLFGDASGDGLTPEDEERRRKRRERNKIAATKCRLKKREKTVNLVQESDMLEKQNHDLKKQIHELENERRNLFDTLSLHGASCTKRPFSGTTPSYTDNYQRCAATPATVDASTTGYAFSGHSYKNLLNCDTSVSYHRSATVEYQRTQNIERFQRANTPYHSFEDSIIRDPAVMFNYCRSDEGQEGYMRADAIYSNLNLNSPTCNQDSPTSTYNRPSSLSLNTSSSDYESNTELLDSPNVTPNNYHHYEDDAGGYQTGFATSSCMS